MSKEDIEWRRIEQDGELKSFVMERWQDGAWANFIPEREYYQIKKLNSVALIVIIIVWIVGLMLA